MMQATDFGNRDDRAQSRRLNWPPVGSVLVEREMSASPVIVREDWNRPLAQSPDDARALHQMCREGRLYDVERWIAEGKPLQLTPGAIRKGTRQKTALQIALESGQHSLAFLLLSTWLQAGARAVCSVTCSG